MKEVHQNKNSLILVLENSVTIRVFVPFLPRVELEGRRVRACGRVQEYRGELEVALSCEAGLRLDA